MADLITSTVAKQALQADPSFSAGDDTIIDALIDSVSKAIQQYCKREFTSATFTETYHGTRDTKLILRQYPIVSVTSVHVAGHEIEEADGEFEVDAPRGILYRRCGWSVDEYQIVVVYVAGFSTVPEDVQAAAQAWVADLYFRWKRDPTIQASSDTGAGTAESLLAASGMPPAVKTLLAPRRKVGV